MGSELLARKEVVYRVSGAVEQGQMIYLNDNHTPIGVAARDLSAMEVVEYDPDQDTEDVIVKTSTSDMWYIGQDEFLTMGLSDVRRLFLEQCYEADYPPELAVLAVYRFSRSTGLKGRLLRSTWNEFMYGLQLQLRVLQRADEDAMSENDRKRYIMASLGALVTIAAADSGDPLELINLRL